NIRSAELCAEAQAAAGTCGAGSRIGTATVTSGSGATPLPLGGQVFLTGAYKGAPFGLAIVVPAKAGPYDLGLVVVRARVEVDRKTAALSVASDPMPTILKGVPLRIRSVDIAVDRPGFMLAPTSCAPATIAGEVRSAGGAVSPSSTRFAVGGCSGLDFEPELGLALGGRGQTTDGKHPALAARLTIPAQNANTKRVQVALPLSLALDPDNAEALCEPSAAAADRCPAASIVGRASAVSILHVPLTGPVYFVRGERRSATGRVIRTLPKLFIPLKGEGVAIDLHASSDVEDDQLVTTFEDIPDAPISRFDLELEGGKNGILVVSDADVCAANQAAGADLVAHSRKIAAGEIPMATPCPLKVLGSSHTPSRLRVKVGGLGAGRVVVTGPGLTRTSRTLAGSTVATVSVPLSRAVQRRLARGADVRIAVRTAFTPAGAKKAKAITRTVTIHGKER
ncbi:MAG TPA: hypothetical protein VN238_10405, partial [Solirubrobacteraceae bacterium]|nr:hypothetical protein [Solirubrobacteraceae bacterium]